MPGFLTASQLSYTLPNGSSLFENLSFSLASGTCSALIGKNGVGKSTLLHILSGALPASSGSVLCHGPCHLMLQQPDESGLHSVAQALGIAAKLQALERISAGHGQEEDFPLIQDDWDLEARIITELAAFHLEYLDLSQPFAPLSGGEKMRVHMVRAFLSQADLLFFDEPTNNLDARAKNLFLQRLLVCKSTVLMVSHDRLLLEHVNPILELDHCGIHVWGGNYSFYLAEKQRAADLLEQRKKLNEKEFQAAQALVQTIQVKQAHSIKSGQKKVAQSRWMPAVANGKKNQAESGQARTARLLERKQKIAQEAKEKLDALTPHDSAISLPPLPVPIPQTQHILEVTQLCFAYSPPPNTAPSPLLLNHLNLDIHGPQRISIEGNSGSGKSTLFRLLMGTLCPLSGHVRFFVPVRWLDQELSCLRPGLSVLENFQAINPNALTQEARYALGRFRFRKNTVEKKIEMLSGGERVKLAFACILGLALPSVLLLDEPTNNLDIESLAIVEDVLAQYSGTLLLISHDEYSLRSLQLTKRYALSEGQLRELPLF